ncbi:MAG TPA: non-ribosomal peptide synthetase, partial [Clostridium sp.]|nr:non-ribosomal peptide synthetase [Clostridium sp.]
MIVNRFEEQVKMYPERIAIKTVDRELSYQLLNNYANGIANEVINRYSEHLENKKSNTVALLFEHGTDMIVGTIGALKANKIYVPFDPSYPIKRLIYMLENSEVTLIITNNRNMELALRLMKETKALIRIFNIDKKDYSTSIENIDRKIYDNDIAYILYTSGSTGKPKGVIQTHKNVLHFIKSYTNTLNITKEDKITLFSAFSHDAAIMDIYGALLNGATLYPLNIKDEISVDELSSWLENEEITIYHSVPTVYRYFVNTLMEKEKGEFEKLRFIVLGGEGVIEHDISMFKKLFTNTSTRLVNLYGQTESSYNSSQIFSPNCEVESITLGHVVKDTEILVVDENREEVSNLRVGEIVVLSDYVALGYWKDKEKTKEVFQHSEEVGKLYWTGDLGRLLEDGSIKFVGRKGSQVKIRGYRVELGEVETQLLNHEDIKEAVVLGRKNTNGDDYLSAYIVSNKPLTVVELREHLSIQLPDYMIPSIFMQLEKIPLTPNKKVDREALIETDKIMLSRIEYEAPRNEKEERLVKVWSEILGIDKIGINDNFFNLGGHSLKATSLVSKIHKEFDVRISLSEVFKSPTIKEMATYIGRAEKNMYIAIDSVEERAYYPVSSAQKRM